MRKYKDPVTGDALTLGEYVSWKIQGIMRNWYFLITITIVTIIVWTTNNDVALTWWNLAASYLALVIESIVGLAMFRQTVRDAVVMREVRSISQNIEAILHHIQETTDLEQQEIEQIMKGREVK